MSVDDADWTAALDRIKSATSILVLAPQMERTVTDICHDLLTPAHPTEAGIIKISYHFGPEQIADRWLDRHPDSEVQLACLSVTDSNVDEPRSEYPQISYATARAEDLTGIGMMINQIIGRLGTQTSEILVCLDSLDNMLMYTDQRTMYRFIRTISNFLSGHNARIHFHIDPTQNTEIINMLRSAVNAVVEVGTDGGVTVKAR